jgi:hypothetical protein
VRHRLVSDGKFTTFNTTIYCDRTDRSAVIYKDHQIEELVELKVMIDDIPSIELDIVMGKDNQAYYLFHFAIELTYQSGSTKYELLHKGGCQISSYQKLEISKLEISAGR